MQTSQVEKATTTQRRSGSITVVVCRDDHTWVIQVSGDLCPSCGSPWKRARYTTFERLELEASQTRPSFQVHTFKPYAEEGFTGENIQIGTKEQRDQLCREHGVSYDGCKQASTPNTAPAIDSIDFGDVKEALKDPKFLDSDCEPDLPSAPEGDNDDGERRND